MYVSLQVGRGLAALAVAAFHLSMAMGEPQFGGEGQRILWRWFSGGDLGVDFFFVLSGFIILQAHYGDIGKSQTLRRYTTRRAIRIFPIYWVYLTSAIIGMTIVNSDSFKLSSWEDWFTAYGLVRITNVTIPLSQAWTLFHEMAFYVIFSILLMGRTAGKFVFALWFLVIATNLYYPALSTQGFRDTVLGAYNLNFLIGMLAFLLTSRLSRNYAFAMLGFGFLGLIAAVIVDSSVRGLSILHIAYAISFGLVVCSVTALERSLKWTLPLACGFIGDASYSIYLLHEHTETYLLRGFKWLGAFNHASHEVLFACTFVITVIVGCSAYYFLERPLLLALRKRIEIGSR